MSKVTANDVNGNEVIVYAAQFNQRGGVESIYIKNGQYMQWVHATDYDVSVADGQQPVEQPGVMSKDTMLKPTTMQTKAPAVNPEPSKITKK